MPRLHGAGNGADDSLAHGGDSSFRPMRSWAFITNHARVLLAVAQNPELRVGEIADAVGIAVRSAYRILAELVEAGYLRRTRVGRRNRYELNRDLPLGDPVVGEHTLRELLSFIGAHRRVSGEGEPRKEG
jgi:DNA-binding transcriptional ArsR family regulator